MNVTSKTQICDINKPVPLINALMQIRQGRTGAEADVFIKELSKNDTVAQKQVVKLLAKGTSAIVFETPDNKILKLTIGNHFPMNRPQESFDVPIFEHTKIGKVHCYIEEKLYQHGLSEAFVAEIKNNIKKAGYRTFDIYDGDVNQIGLSRDGKLYLLDPECAGYKTIFHAVLAKVKRLLMKFK